jgi:hypothetical protein
MLDSVFLVMSGRETELLLWISLGNALVSLLAVLIAVRMVNVRADERASQEHDRWKGYLNAEYIRILSETKSNQQEIQELVGVLRAVVVLLRERAGIDVGEEVASVLRAD